MEQKEFYSVKELADLLTLSRVAVFKKIQQGKIKAEKVGRNYIIRKEELANILGEDLSFQDKKEIEAGVDKTVKEYGEVLKKLGKE